MAKPFSIYRSSAGSGKTRTLAREYLKLALRYRDDYFKYILAVTFTNKASQEMKDRILFYLDAFAQGRQNELAQELKHELQLDDQTFQERSRATQAAILHGYSQFAISTIDAFFQKVIRSFTRESGLVGDYRLEVEQDGVLESVIDNLIDELGDNKQLTDWVVEFAKDNLENERAWDVRYSLIEFAREIFREEFKSIEETVAVTTSQPGYFKNLRDTLWGVKMQFIAEVSQPALMVLNTIETYHWTAEDFSYGKNSGLFTFLNVFGHERNLSKIKPPGDRIRNYFTTAENWPGKKTPHARQIVSVASQEFIPRINSILSAYEKNFRKALTAEVALKNLYVFGLIADIARKLKEYKDENSMMLLADAPKFLNGVIQDSDTPFIYEKVGSFYRNYLIDEFQDTSGMQWKNFRPLITNSLDQGYASLVVGDVKQAIYRWRGGDLSLLQQEIESHIGTPRLDIHELGTNFRSAAEVVNFNNALFEKAASIISAETGTAIAPEVYRDAAQQVAKTQKGFIHIQFITEPSDQKNVFTAPEEAPEPGAARWRQLALEHIPKFLEQLQHKGIPLKDVAILVRKNEEGQRIANYLLQYKTSPSALPDCRYDVVSNESLRIDGAASVNLLLGAMRYLLNPEDSIARAQLGYEFSRIHEPHRELPEVFSITNQVIFENNLPEEFSKQKPALKKLALIELTESLIEIFQLGRISGELIHLQAFQDLVLEFYNRERNDLGAFLEWWEDNKHKKSIQIPGEVNAAQILTIHKSKGLQFKYVLIPFCAWSLDHDNWQAPNLWVTSDESPFQDVGYVPVKYGKGLDETYFSEYYRAERTRTYLDNLNLLYVAFTRAENGLIITAPSIEVRSSKDTVAALIHHSIQRHEHLVTHWRESEQTFISGEWEAPSTFEKELSESPTLSEYHASSWRKKLVIRTSGGEYFSELHDEVRNKINFGIYMHAVLSRVRYAGEIDSALDQIAMEGLIATDQRTALEREIKDLISLPKVMDWFSTRWEVRTEVPVILPGGGESRIDRLLLLNKAAIVIDFKTGERKKSDQQQVLDYITTLRQMNFHPVEGYLLYLRDKEVVEVPSGGKTRMAKKIADKDQLSLGI